MVNRTFGSSALSDEKIETKVIDLADYGNKKNNIEEKIQNLTKEISKDLNGDSKLEKELESKIKSIIKEDEIKTSGEEINDISSIISRNLEKEDNVGSKNKSIEIKREIENWKDNNPDEVLNFKKEEFKKDFEKELKKLNPDLSEEKISKSREYADLIAENGLDNQSLDKYKDQALESNTKVFGPGKIENSWGDLQQTVNFLKKTPDEIKDIKNKFDSIKSDLKDVHLPDNIRQVRSFENIISNFGNQNTDLLFSKTKSRLDRFDFIDKITGGRLRSSAVDIGQKFVSKIGNQAMQEFATNALSNFAEFGARGAFDRILEGIVSGGVKSVAATTAETAVTGEILTGATAAVGEATAAGVAGVGTVAAAGEAVAAGTAGVAAVGGEVAAGVAGVGTVAAAGEAVAAGTAGVAAGAGAVTAGTTAVAGATAAAGTAGAIATAASAAIASAGAALAAAGAVILIIIVVVIGGFLIFSIFNSGPVASLVPPKGAGEYIDEEYQEQEEVIIPPGEDIPDAPVVPGNPTGEAIVATAKERQRAGLCYWFGGGHGHLYDKYSNGEYKFPALPWSRHEPYLGEYPLWNNYKYLGTDNTWHYVIDNPGSDNVRHTFGLDCSGFVDWVYRQNGIDLGIATAETLYRKYGMGEIVSNNYLRAGDLGFKVKYTSKSYDANTNPMVHIGIYSGRVVNGSREWIQLGSSGYYSFCSYYDKDGNKHSQLGLLKTGSYGDFQYYGRVIR